MKRAARLTLWAVGLVLLAAALHRLTPVSPPQAGPTLDIQQIRQLAQLVTLNVPITDQLTTQIAGYTGSLQTLIAVRGDVDFTVDLGHARFEQVDAEHRCAVLVLPEPQPTRPRLDHQHTRIYTLTPTGLWHLALTLPYEELETKALQQAQHRIETAARDPSLLPPARQHAETVLKNFCRNLGWRIVVRWT